MPFSEMTVVNLAGASKAAMLGMTKISMAAGPVALPLVIAGALGSLLLMDQAASRTAHIIVKSGDT